jgi:hypothetical protein
VRGRQEYSLLDLSDAMAVAGPARRRRKLRQYGDGGWREADRLVVVEGDPLLVVDFLDEGTAVEGRFPLVKLSGPARPPSVSFLSR